MGETLLFKNIFPVVDTCLSYEDVADNVVPWCPDGEFFNFLSPAFPASRVQHISDMHSKFALGSHHV